MSNLSASVSYQLNSPKSSLFLSHWASLAPSHTAIHVAVFLSHTMGTRGLCEDRTVNLICEYMQTNWQAVFYLLIHLHTRIYFIHCKFTSLYGNRRATLFLFLSVSEADCLFSFPWEGLQLIDDDLTAENAKSAIKQGGWFWSEGDANKT